MVDIATLIARDEGWLTDEEVRRLGVTPLSELESVKKDSGVKCVQCGRPFGEEDRRASMSASVMGDEYTESYFLCPDCNVYTLEIVRYVFCGPTEVQIAGRAISREEGDKKTRAAKRCKEPWDKNCRCKAHRDYFGGGLD